MSFYPQPTVFCFCMSTTRLRKTRQLRNTSGKEVCLTLPGGTTNPLQRWTSYRKEFPVTSWPRFSSFFPLKWLKVWHKLDFFFLNGHIQKYNLQKIFIAASSNPGSLVQNKINQTKKKKIKIKAVRMKNNEQCQRLCTALHCTEQRQYITITL